MAWTNPTSVATGDVLTASRWNDQVQANLTEFNGLFVARTTWTPTVTQVGNVTITNQSRYVKVGRLVLASLYFTVSGSGTAGTVFTVSLPETAAVNGSMLGSGGLFDASTVTNYSGLWVAATTTTASFSGDWSGQQAWGNTPNIGLASNDIVRGMFMYEAAS